MKNAKIVAEWDDSKGCAAIEMDGKTLDVYRLLCVTVMQYFDAAKTPYSVGLASLAASIGYAQKAMLAKVDLDALKRAKEQGHE